MALAGKRVSDATTSVMQLADDPEGKTRILLAAFTTACAGLAAAYLTARDGHASAEVSSIERLNLGIEAMKVLRDAAMRIGR